MMFKTLIGLFLLLHILGDFYFQSNTVSEQKKTEFRYVVIHSILYSLTLFIGIIPFWSILSYAALILALIHFIIEYLKYMYTKKIKPEALPIVFYIEQFLNIAVIVAISLIIIFNKSLHSALATSKSLIAGKDVIVWLCLILLVHKPTNITIKQMISSYKPIDVNSHKSAGAFIGTLERYIILLLLSVNQYSAVGLVLTAKSVARFDKISKDQAFAEYYLLGTLLSTLLVIISFKVFL